MLSIPRDLYVQYGDNQKGKINRLYEDSFEKTSSLVLAMEDLEEKVEEITNQEIDYFVNLDFK
jgi:anionic cell wall polymer biosynthesis LytR-Cps2A-Psr (LCP) family protein